MRGFAFLEASSIRAIFIRKTTNCSFDLNSKRKTKKRGGKKREKEKEKGKRKVRERKNKQIKIS